MLQVGHLERFFAIETGLIDAVTMPVYIEAVRIAPFQPRGNDVSVVLDLMIHDIDLISALVRSPVADVEAVGTPVLSDQEDIVNTRLRFENGCVANITASRVAFKSERRMRIFQPDRLLSVDLLKRRYATVRKKDPAACSTNADDFLLDEREFSEHDALRAELRSFVTAVATGTPPVVSGEDGRAALAIGNRIIESLQRHAELVRGRVRAAEAARRRDARPRTRRYGSLTLAAAPVPLVDLEANYARLKPRVDARLATALAHGRFVLGPEVAELEAELARRAGVAHAVGVASGTDALMIALRAEGIGPGNAVFVPAFSFVATAGAVVLAGATPVFCDVDPATFHLDPDDLERRAAALPASLRPRAVVPVDLFGLPADYGPIRAFAAGTACWCWPTPRRASAPRATAARWARSPTSPP